MLTKEEREKVSAAGANVELSARMSGGDFRAKRMWMRRTVYEVADVAGVDYWTVYEFERGRMKQDPERIGRLCRALMVLSGDVPRRRRAAVFGWDQVTSPYACDSEVVTERERRVFVRHCTKWNARGLRRLSPWKFERAINAILIRPSIYQTIDRRATFSPAVDEVD